MTPPRKRNHHIQNSTPLTENHTGPRDLAERMTGGPSFGRLSNGNGASNGQDNGFTFKGAATEPPGFSIRGASRDINPKVKELFPSKVGGNAGKELFPSGGARARGGPRAPRAP